MTAVILIMIPVAVVAGACLLPRGRALAALAVVVVALSVLLWLGYSLGCGWENHSARFYARCHQAYPVLPLWGAAIVVLGAALGVLTRSHVVVRAALVLALVLALVPSVVAVLVFDATGRS